MKKPQTTANILNIKLHSTSKAQVLDIVFEHLKSREQFTITTPNPEIIVQAQTNPNLASFLNSATLSIPDGIGLKLFRPKLKRIPGRELMLDLFHFADKHRLKVFLLGSTQAVNTQSVSQLSDLCPKLKVKGSSGPMLDQNAIPVSKRDIAVQSDTVKSINRFQPDILFIAFGAPKQELWLKKHLPSLKAGGAMVVGGSLDYFSGKKSLPPSILGKLGLEWLWRGITEPAHARRVFRATISFPLLVLAAIILPKKH